MFHSLFSQINVLFLLKQCKVIPLQIQKWIISEISWEIDFEFYFLYFEGLYFYARLLSLHLLISLILSFIIFTHYFLKEMFFFYLLWQHNDFSFETSKRNISAFSLDVINLNINILYFSSLWVLLFNLKCIYPLIGTLDCYSVSVFL